ncbi:MAG: hypothetical protein HGA44_01320 [Cellulomonadaceae bacterium]|nr:hypothetical protein [Cellulomonadaceae bacterium]
MTRSVNRSSSTGRFVSSGTAARSPRTTVTQTVAGKKSGGTVNQSAITGRFVSDATARRHPDTTITRAI